MFEMNEAPVSGAQGPAPRREAVSRACGPAVARRSDDFPRG